MAAAALILLPVVLGCGFRVWWPDLTPPLAQWVLRVSILCLLFNLNFTLVAYWDLFKQTWGTESYIAAFAGPFIGLACGYLLVSTLRVKDVAIRHATVATTAVRNIGPMLLMMILSVCGRSAGHGVDHDPQHRRHHDRSTVRPDVEARCFTVGRPRGYVSCRTPRSGCHSRTLAQAKAELAGSRTFPCWPSLPAPSSGHPRRHRRALPAVT